MSEPIDLITTVDHWLAGWVVSRGAAVRRRTEDMWATVFGSRPEVRHDAVVVRDDDEALMTTTLTAVDVPDGVVLEVDGARAFARVTVDGVHAAEGQVGLAGGHAVFDRIRTHDGFQRRGLGTRVMQALTA